MKQWTVSNVCVLTANPMSHGLRNGNEQVYEKYAPNADKCAILLHGRTWSALPVWDLTAPPPAQPHKQAREPLSFMDALVGHGFHVLAVDLRGFGATPRDASKWLTPDTCVKDTLAVVDWAKNQRGFDAPALVGWSQGGLIAQMLAQQHADRISQLVLYGTIYHSSVVYQRPPILTQGLCRSELPYFATCPYDRDLTSRATCTDQQIAPQKATTYEQAIEDFTLPGTISVEAIAAFGESALLHNPIKVDWSHYHEFNICNPAKVWRPILPFSR